MRRRFNARSGRSCTSMLKNWSSSGHGVRNTGRPPWCWILTPPFPGATEMMSAMGISPERTAPSQRSASVVMPDGGSSWTVVRAEGIEGLLVQGA
jgi:hypothetical protein